MSLRTARQDVIHVQGASVSFAISSAGNPKTRYPIHNAFTADNLNLAEHSCPLDALQKRYPHLQGLPLQNLDKVQPLVRIGSDHPHILLPTEPIHSGPMVGPVAVCTALGWAVQGPASLLPPSTPTQCLFASALSPSTELLSNVEKLWQVDAFPHRNEKEVTRSKQDQYALSLLETKTTRVFVDGVKRYATPLSHAPNSPPLSTSKHAVMSLLRGTECRLAKNPKLAAVHNHEIHKPVDAGYVTKVSPEVEADTEESWYLPHHIIEQHSGK